MKHLLFFIFFFSIVIIHAQPQVITTGLEHPESITSDGKFLYVSNVGSALKPMDKDGDGSIHKLSLDGKVIDLHFNKGKLNAPKGTVVIKDVLYTTDVDRVVAIDTRTGETVREIDFSSYGTVFLNDIVVKDDATLFVGALDIGKIFSISLSKNDLVEALPIEVKGPNGLLYNRDNKKLYVVGLARIEEAQGEIASISWENGKCVYQTISDLKGHFDGIQQIDKNTLIVSDWYSFKDLKCRLLKVELKTGKSSEWIKDTDAADIYYDRNNKRLLLPGLREGKIAQLELK